MECKIKLKDVSNCLVEIANKCADLMKDDYLITTIKFNEKDFEIIKNQEGVMNLQEIYELTTDNKLKQSEIAIIYN